jgi:hypothetical protein
VELSFLVDANHPLVKLGGRINWAAFEEQLAPTYHDKTGAPGNKWSVSISKKSTRKRSMWTMGYRGHDYAGPAEVLTDRRGRCSIPKRIWRLMNRRAAVEPTIGHFKRLTNCIAIS